MSSEKYIYKKKQQTTTNEPENVMKWESFDLPNWEKMSSDLLVKLCLEDSNPEQILDILVDIPSQSPPAIEGFQLDWKQLTHSIYSTKIPLNKIQLLANSRYVSKIEMSRDQ